MLYIKKEQIGTGRQIISYANTGITVLIYSNRLYYGPSRVSRPIYISIIQYNSNDSRRTYEVRKVYSIQNYNNSRVASISTIKNSFL